MVTNSAGDTFNFNFPQGRSHDFLMLTRWIAASGHGTEAEKRNFNKSTKHVCVTLGFHHFKTVVRFSTLLSIKELRHG